MVILKKFWLLLMQGQIQDKKIRVFHNIKKFKIKKEKKLNKMLTQEEMEELYINITIRVYKAIK